MLYNIISKMVDCKTLSKTAFSCELC